MNCAVSRFAAALALSLAFPAAHAAEAGLGQALADEATGGAWPADGREGAAYLAGAWAVAPGSRIDILPVESLDCSAPLVIALTDSSYGDEVEFRVPGRPATRHELTMLGSWIVFVARDFTGLWDGPGTFRIAPERNDGSGLAIEEDAVRLTRCTPQ